MNFDFLSEREPRAGMKVEVGQNLFLEDMGLMTRNILGTLLKCFPANLIEEQVELFFSTIIDHEETWEDPASLDVLIDGIASSVMSNWSGKSSSKLGKWFNNSSLIEKMRDQMKQCIFKQGVIHFLYKQKKAEFLRALNLSFKTKPERKEKFLLWLEEAKKGLHVFSETDFAEVISSPGDDVLIKFLAGKTRIISVPLFMMRIINVRLLMSSHISWEMQVVAFEIKEDLNN